MVGESSNVICVEWTLFRDKAPGLLIIDVIPRLCKLWLSFRTWPRDWSTVQITSEMLLNAFKQA